MNVFLRQQRKVTNAQQKKIEDNINLSAYLTTLLSKEKLILVIIPLFGILIITHYLTWGSLIRTTSREDGTEWKQSTS